jgi:cell division protein FtsB
MPPGHSASAAPRYQRQPRTRTGPRRVAPRRGAVRIRWDRVGRVGLLLVLSAVVGLYVQHALSYLSTTAEANRQSAIVKRLARDNATLTKQRGSLNDPATIERYARVLGMVQAGERPYVVTGLPKQ